MGLGAVSGLLVFMIPHVMHYWPLFHFIFSEVSLDEGDDDEMWWDIYQRPLFT
jgi:hypothetical protein